MTRDQVIRRTVEALRSQDIDDRRDRRQLTRAIERFGQKTTNRSMWITTATHCTSISAS